MRSLHFTDTDTLLYMVSDERVTDFADLDYQTLIEFGEKGLPVSLTVEHASERVPLPKRNPGDPPGELRPELLRREYVPDTDTLFFQFSQEPIAEHIELGEMDVLAIDDIGHLVSMTIKHAAEREIIPQQATDERSQIVAAD